MSGSCGWRSCVLGRRLARLSTRPRRWQRVALRRSRPRRRSRPSQRWAAARARAARVRRSLAARAAREAARGCRERAARRRSRAALPRRSPEHANWFGDYCRPQRWRETCNDVPPPSDVACGCATGLYGVMGTRHGVLRWERCCSRTRLTHDVREGLSSRYRCTHRDPHTASCDACVRRTSCHGWCLNLVWNMAIQRLCVPIPGLSTLSVPVTSHSTTLDGSALRFEVAFS